MPDHYDNPASTVDLIVPYDGGIIYVKRKHAPFKGFWALPGGFLERGKETLEEAGIRELREETSLRARKEDLRLVAVYSEPNRDPRGHIISHVYEVPNVEGILRADDDAEDARVFSEPPEKLAFDHALILKNYMEAKRNGS